MVFLFEVQEIDGMGKTKFGGHTQVSLCMMCLEHPFQLAWDGKGQKLT